MHRFGEVYLKNKVSLKRESKSVALAIIHFFKSLKILSFINSKFIIFKLNSSNLKLNSGTGILIK